MEHLVEAAFDFDATLAINPAGYASVDFADLSAIADLVPLPAAEYAQGLIEAGQRVAIVSGRPRAMAPAVRAWLDAHGLEKAALYVTESFEGFGTLAFWKAGVLEVLQPRLGFWGDHESDQRAAELASVAFHWQNEVPVAITI